jgi:phage RecT family recombinase
VNESQTAAPQTALAKVNFEAPAGTCANLKNALMSLKLDDGVMFGISKEQIIGFGMTACTRQPALLDCTILSILQCLQEATRLGLDASGSLGHAYMIPFNNSKTGQKIATLIIGYQGFVALMFRGGMLKNIYAVPVFAGEEFMFYQGTEQRIVHVPDIDKTHTEAEMRGVYGVAHLLTGGVAILWMPRDELLAIKGRSKSLNKSDSPWNVYPLEMHKKSVIRRLRKSVPMNPAQQPLVARAEEIDNADFEVIGSESGNGQKRRATEENLSALGNLGKKEVQQEPGEPPLGALSTDPPEAQESFMHGGN